MERLIVKQLSPEQRELVLSLTKRLGAIRGIKAVVLGGSHARGRAQPGSDIDLGLLYSEAAPFSIQSVRELAEEVNDTAGPSPRRSGATNAAGMENFGHAGGPVVTDFYGWGPWVNGGAWLTIGGQRVDFIYRCLEQMERVITEAEAGRYEVHYLQQPPFGFFSGTYLGEIAVCIPLFDSEARLDVLKRRVADYPEALRQAVVQDYLFMAEFTLTAFAPKVAARSDPYGTAACLTRAVNELVLALFALNRKYPINDKTALSEIAQFERAPREFGPRVQKTLGHLGASPAELVAAVENVAQLLRETIKLTDGLYQPRFTLPK
jgi:predicted nucleotidyltransferase